MSPPVSSWRIPPQTRARIAARVQVVSCRECAAEFGVHMQSVINIRNEFGIPSRGRGQKSVWGGLWRKYYGEAWPLKARAPRALWWARGRRQEAAA